MRPDRHAFVLLKETPSSGGLPAEAEAWRRSGRPFVVASAHGDDPANTVRLGLATPDKRRIGFRVPGREIGAVLGAPGLAEARDHAPAGWLPAMAEVERVAAAAGIVVRVFGSLAWTCRAGIAFLRPGSDLDLLLAPSLADAEGLQGAVDALLAIDAGGPRLDGELVLPGGGAVNFREWAGRPGEILVKAHGGARLARADEVARLLGRCSV